MGRENPPKSSNGAIINYVDNKWWVGRPKMSILCQSDQKNPKTKYVFENSLASKGKHCCFYVGIQFSTQNCTFESIENPCFNNLIKR